MRIFTRLRILRHQFTQVYNSLGVRLCTDIMSFFAEYEWTLEAENCQLYTVHNSQLHLCHIAESIPFWTCLLYNKALVLDLTYSSPIHIINICHTNLHLAPDSYTFRKTWPLIGTKNLLTLVVSSFLAITVWFLFGKTQCQSVLLLCNSVFRGYACFGIFRKLECCNLQIHHPRCVLCK
jgi:hypothetical protein